MNARMHNRNYIFILLLTLDFPEGSRAQGIFRGYKGLWKVSKTVLKTYHKYKCKQFL
jgi:hypothetical protein